MKSLAAACVAALLLTGCGADGGKAATPTSSPTPTSFQIVGTITVESGDGSEDTMGGWCVTDGGYSDISTGADVTVTNESGKIIAIGALDGGHVSKVITLPSMVDFDETVDQATECIFGFTLADVPEGEEFYSIEVASRGALRYTRADLKGPLLELSLGG